MLPLFSWLLAIPILGAMTGLRSMTPIAVICFFAWRGHAGVAGTWAQWTAHPVSAGLFALFAVGELIVDKLPKTPKRTDIGPVIVRIVFGGLVGAIAATCLGGASLEGAFLGGISALAGTFVGYQIRQHLVKVTGYPDLPVALVEDTIAVGLSFLMVGVITG